MSMYNLAQGKGMSVAELKQLKSDNRRIADNARNIDFANVMLQIWDVSAKLTVKTDKNGKNRATVNVVYAGTSCKFGINTFADLNPFALDYKAANAAEKAIDRLARKQENAAKAKARRAAWAAERKQRMRANAPAIIAAFKAGGQSDGEITANLIAYGFRKVDAAELVARYAA